MYIPLSNDKHCLSETTQKSAPEIQDNIQDKIQSETKSEIILFSNKNCLGLDFVSD